MTPKPKISWLGINRSIWYSYSSEYTGNSLNYSTIEQEFIYFARSKIIEYFEKISGMDIKNKYDESVLLSKKITFETYRDYRIEVKFTMVIRFPQEWFDYLTRVALRIPMNYFCICGKPVNVLEGDYRLYAFGKDEPCFVDHAECYSFENIKERRREHERLIQGEMNK